MDPRQEYHPYNPYIYAQSGRYPFLLQRQQASSNFLSSGTGVLHSPASIAHQPLSSLPSPFSYHQPHQQRRPDDGRILYVPQAPSASYLPDRPSQHFSFTTIQPAMPSIRVSERVSFSNDLRDASAFQHQDHRLRDAYVHGGVKRERSSVIGAVQGSHLHDRNVEIPYLKKPRLEEELPPRNVAFLGRAEGRGRCTMNSPYSHAYSVDQREATSTLPRLRSTVHLKSSSPAHSSSNMESSRSHVDRYGRGDEVHFSPRRSSQQKHSVLSRLQFGKPAWKKKCKQRGDDQISASSEFSQTNLDGTLELDISFESNVLRAKEKLTSTDGEDDSKGTIELKGNKNKVENLDEESVRPSIARKRERGKVIVSSPTVPSSGGKEAKVSENGIQENLGKEILVDEGEVDVVSNTKSCLKDEEQKVSAVCSTENVAASGTGMNLEETLVDVKEVLEKTSEISFVPAIVDVEEGEIPGEASDGKESGMLDLSKSVAKSDDLNSPNAMILSKKKRRRPKKKKKLGAFNSPLVSTNEQVDTCKGHASSLVPDGVVPSVEISQVRMLNSDLKQGHAGDVDRSTNQSEIAQKLFLSVDSSSLVLNTSEDIQSKITPNPFVLDGSCSKRSVEGNTVAKRDSKEGTVIPSLHDSLLTQEIHGLLPENSAAGSSSVSQSKDHNFMQVHDNTPQSELKKSNQSEILPKAFHTEDSSSPTLNAMKDIQVKILPNPSGEEGSCWVRSVEGDVIAKRDTKIDTPIPPLRDSLPTQVCELLPENNAVRSLSIFPSNGHKFMHVRHNTSQSEFHQDMSNGKKNYTCPVPGCKENGHRVILKPQMLVQSFSFGKQIQKGIQPLKNQRKLEHLSGVPTIESRELDRLFSFGVQPQIKEARQSTCNPQDLKQCFPGTSAENGATVAKKKKCRVKKGKGPINCIEKKKWTWKRNEVATSVPPLVGGSEPGDICEGNTSTFVPAKGVVHSVEISQVQMSNSDLKQDRACDADKSHNQSEIAQKVFLTVDSLSPTLNALKDIPNPFVEEDSCSMRPQEGKKTEKRDAKEGTLVQPLHESLPTQEVSEVLLENNALGSLSVSLMNDYGFMQVNDKTLQSELNWESSNDKNVYTCPVQVNVDENDNDINPRPQMLDHTVSFAKVIHNGNQDLKNEKKIEQSAGVTAEAKELDCLFSSGVQSQSMAKISEVGQPFCDPLEGNNDSRAFILEKMQEASGKNSEKPTQTFSFGVQPQCTTEILPNEAGQAFGDLLDDRNISSAIIVEKVADESSGKNDSALDPEVKNSGRSDRLFAFGVQLKQATKADNSCVTAEEKRTDNKGILGQKSEVSNMLPSHQTSQHPSSFKKPSDCARRNTWRRTENVIGPVASSRSKQLGVGSSSRQSPEKLSKIQSSYVRKGNSLIRKPSSVIPFTNSCSDQAALNKTSGPEKETKGKVSPTDRLNINRTEVFEPLLLSDKLSHPSEPHREESGSLSVESQHSEANEENCTDILVVSPATLSNKETAHAKNSMSGLAIAAETNGNGASLSITEEKTAALSLAPIVFNYRRIRNKLIRDLSSSGSRSSSKLSSKSTAYELKKATMNTYKSSRFSLVWTLNGKESENHKDHNPLKRCKVLPYLFPWKRTALQGNVFTRRSHLEKHPSLLTRKLQQLRRKNTPASYTSGRSIVRHSLKWSKSMEKRSRKEATSAITEHQKERRKEEKTPLTDLGAKKGVGSQCERVFRVGTLLYKMDPSRRTLIRIPDGQKTPVKRKPVLEGKMAIVPRRLSIGNDEYVRVGNGNQLVRDPKKLVRILASEKIRWSLHTARQRSIRKQRYCQFFTRFGRCNKEEGRCPYIHDPTKVAICSKFLKGLCFEPNCKLTHKVIPERMPDCSYFLEGLCTNSSCPYRHVNVNPKASLCKGFLRGYCRDGDECRKKHSYACPQFEASGKCPQGSSCKLHHKKAILPQKRKRVWAETHSWGRYFGGVPDQSFLPAFSAGLEAKGEDEADVFFQEGRFTEFISLNNDDDNDDDRDDDGKRLAPGSSSSKHSSTHLLDQVLNDDDAIIKPLGIMR